MFRKFIRFSFIPSSLFLWFIYSGITLENPCNDEYCGPQISNISLFLLVILLGIYSHRILLFLIKRFKLKVKAHWFFNYFLASAILILLFEIVPFLDNLEVNGLLALFLLTSCGISFILSLSFGIKTFFARKLET